MQFNRRDQRAVCFASRAARRPVALRRRPLRFTNRALVTSLHGAGPQARRASVCGSAAGRCAAAAIRYALLSTLRSTFPARRPQTEAQRLIHPFGHPCRMRSAKIESQANGWPIGQDR